MNKGEQKAAVYGNWRRIQGLRGKALLRKRGQMLECPFAHLFETGGRRRLYVRGKANVQKKLLLQAAACNLALILRQMLGAGTPRGLQDRLVELFWTLFRIVTHGKVRMEGQTGLSHPEGRTHSSAPTGRHSTSCRSKRSV